MSDGSPATSGIPAEPGTISASVVSPVSPAPRVVDAEELARLAAETVALIEHHRAELRSTMAELTALQRSVRSELRAALVEVSELTEQLDPGVPPDAADR